MDFLKWGDIALHLLDPLPVLTAAVVFWPIEGVIPLERGRFWNRPAWRTDLAYLFVNGAVIRIFMLLVAAGLTVATRSPVPAAMAQAVRSQPLWLQLVEAIAAADLGVYLMHRLCHAWPVLWRFHAIHHSSQRLDWIATFKVHPVDQVLSSSASMAPLILFGFSEWALAGYVLIYRWHSILLHSNIRLPLGRVGLVIATPEFHHWHHSIERQAWDRNFAAQIAAWDVIFRTAYLPAGRRSSGYGVRDPIPPAYVDQIFHPVRAARQPGLAAPSEPI